MSEQRQKPALGLGTIVNHGLFGKGRILSYDGFNYIVIFKEGEVKRVAFEFSGMEAVGSSGDPERDLIASVVREVLGEHEVIDTTCELHPRWVGGEMQLIPGKSDTQGKSIPLEAFFKKIIGVREKLRVLEQKINNHSSLSDPEKLELQGYLTRCYGSLTSFNILFSAKESRFVGQSGKDD